MRRIIEKFYDFIFMDKESPEEVPYGNKVFMFYFSIIVSAVVFTLITRDIIKNIRKSSAEIEQHQQ